ncbi:hypothetical protein M0812_04839 [Anaeramoeba flamelloides]|uniref:Tyrosine-protein kinase ephrin type A/B receptor-like domain-containing protein n=1 Tax=Anaeramoeba flamelloides TaxID=1746091 RepID=A0AAV8AAA0_9EUKA|nr:hypothetical protein M0812_04839 [Anaeramoeba flamelloides]
MFKNYNVSSLLSVVLYFLLFGLVILKTKSFWDHQYQVSDNKTQSLPAIMKFPKNNEQTKTPQTVLLKNPINPKEIPVIGLSFGVATWYFGKDSVTISHFTNNTIEIEFESEGDCKLIVERCGHRKETKQTKEKQFSNDRDDDEVTNKKTNNNKPGLQKKQKRTQGNVCSVQYHWEKVNITLEFVLDKGSNNIKSNIYLPSFKSLGKFKLKYNTDLGIKMNELNELELYNTSTLEVLIKESQPIFLQKDHIVQGQYVLSRQDKGLISFQIQDDQKSHLINFDQPIVIDPTYSTYVGGKGDDKLFNSNYDSQGMVISVGYSSSVDFFEHSSQIENGYNPGSNKRSGLIIKMDPIKEQLIFSTFIGSELNDSIYTSALDHTNNDNIIIAGYTLGYQNGNNWDDFSYFPTVDSSYKTECTKTDKKQGFVSQISSNGEELLWSTYICSTNFLEIYDVQIYTDSEIIICGNFIGDVESVSGKSDIDVFIGSLTLDGTNLTECLTYCGSLFDGFIKPTSSMMLIKDDLLFLIGVTNSTRISAEKYNGGESDCFLLMYNLTGYALMDVWYFGTSEVDYCYALSNDRVDSTYIWIGGSTKGKFSNDIQNGFQISRINDNSNYSEGIFILFDYKESKILYQSYFGQLNQNIEINGIKAQYSIDNGTIDYQTIEGLMIYGNGYLNNNTDEDHGGNGNTNANTNTNREIDLGEGSFIIYFDSEYLKILKNITIGCQEIYDVSSRLLDDSNYVYSVVGFSKSYNQYKTSGNAFAKDYLNGTSDGILANYHFNCLSGYYKSEIDDACKPCLKGQYANTTNSGNSGYSDNYENVCVDCQAGTYSANIASTVCLPCERGTYGNLIGLSACFSCNNGTYNPMKGSTSVDDCIKCDMGTYSITSGSASNSSCLPCPKGTFNENFGSDSIDECTPCPLGTFNPNPGSYSKDQCLPCENNFYSESVGSTVCLQCENGFQPDSLHSKCVPCSEGFYKNNETSLCTKCPINTFNNEKGKSICKKCNIGIGCLGGNQCVEGRDPQHGCNSCKSNYYMDNFDCIKCPTRAGLFTILTFFLLMFVLFYFFIRFVIHQKKAKENYSKRNANVDAGVGVGVGMGIGVKVNSTLSVDTFGNANGNGNNNGNLNKKEIENENERKKETYNFFDKIIWILFEYKDSSLIGMVITSIQVVSAILQLKLEWPDHLQGNFKIFISIVNFKFMNYLFQECNPVYSYLTKLIMMFVIPIIVCCIYLLVWYWIYYKNNYLNKSKLDFSTFKIDFIYLTTRFTKYLYLPILLIFSDCFNFTYDADEKQYILDSNYRITMNENIWNAFLGIIVFISFVGILGIPILICTCILCAKRKKFKSQYLNKRFGWIWNPYKPNCYWWEIVEIFLKFFIAGTIIFRNFLYDQQDTNYRWRKSWLIMFLIFVITILIFFIRPYKYTKNEYFGSQNFVLFGFYICIISFISSSIKASVVTFLFTILFPVGSIFMGIGLKNMFKEYSQVYSNTILNKDHSADSGDGDSSDFYDSSDSSDFSNANKNNNIFELDSLSSSDYSSADSSESISNQNYIDKLTKEYQSNLTTIKNLQFSIKNTNEILRSCRERSIELVRIKNNRHSTLMRNSNSKKDLILKKININEKNNSIHQDGDEHDDGASGCDDDDDYDDDDDEIEQPINSLSDHFSSSDFSLEQISEKNHNSNNDFDYLINNINNINLTHIGNINTKIIKRVVSVVVINGNNSVKNIAKAKNSGDENEKITNTENLSENISSNDEFSSDVLLDLPQTQEELAKEIEMVRYNLINAGDSRWDNK